jgi:hypothetical protein
MQFATLFFAIIGAAMATTAAENEEWLVLHSARTGAIVSIRPSVPAESVRSEFAFEARFSWKYSENDLGMPASESELRNL